MLSSLSDTPRQRLPRVPSSPCSSPRSPALSLDFFSRFFLIFLGSGRLLSSSHGESDGPGADQFPGASEDFLGRRSLTKCDCSSRCAASLINIRYWHCIPSSSPLPTTCPSLSSPRFLVGYLAPATCPSSSSPTPDQWHQQLWCLPVPAPWSNCPTRLRSQSAPSHSLLAHSILLGHVSPRSWCLPLTCSRAGPRRTAPAHWTRVQGVFPTHLVHMVPNFSHGRPELRSSAPAPSSRTRSVAGPLSVAPFLSPS